jgi:hypothetical protein
VSQEKAVNQDLARLLSHAPLITLPIRIDESTWQGDLDRSLVWIRSEPVTQFFGANPPETKIRLWCRFLLGDATGIIVIKSHVSEQARSDRYFLFMLAPDGKVLAEKSLAEFKDARGKREFERARVGGDLHIATCSPGEASAQADSTRGVGGLQCRCSAVNPKGRIEDAECAESELATLATPDADALAKDLHMKQLLSGFAVVPLPLEINKTTMTARPAKTLPVLAKSEAQHFLQVDPRDRVFHGWGKFDLPGATAMIVVQSEDMDGWTAWKGTFSFS